MKILLLILLLTSKALNVALFTAGLFLLALAAFQPFALPPEPFDPPADHSVLWKITAIAFGTWLFLTSAVIRPIDRRLKAAGA